MGFYYPWGIMLFASIIIYLIFSLFLYPRIFEKFSFSKLLLVFFLCVFSINVLVSEILGLLHVLNHPWIFLTAQFLFCIIVLLVVHRYSPLSKQKLKSVFSLTDFHLSIFELFLLVLISATFIGFFAVGITTPINNVDSLATHLPRIYYWLQHGSLDYWTTLNQFQLAYPINAHLQGLWLFLFGKSENLFFLVQWFSLLIISVSTYEISKILGFSNTQALVSTVIGLSLPIVLLQTFSFQGDLTVTALFMVFITFILIFHHTNQMRFLWLAILSILLAFGTKQSALITIPMSFIAVLYLVISKKCFKKFLATSWLFLGIFILFTSYQFIQNVVQTHTLSGMDWQLAEQYTSFSQFQQKSQFVIPRYLYQFVGIDGLPRSILPTVIQIKENVFKAILTPFGIDLEKEIFLQPGFDQVEAFKYNSYPLLSEDTAWFGPLAFLLIPLATLLTFFSKVPLRRKYALFSLLYSLSYFCLIFIQRPGWDPYQGRYFILGIYPLIPMVSILLPKQNILRAFIITLLVSCSVMLIFNTLLKNDTKPIITARSQNNFIHQVIDPLGESNAFQVFIKKVLYKITYPTGFENPRRYIYSQKYYDQLFYTNNLSAKNIEFINSLIPEGEPITLMIKNNPLEYALFGVNRSRALYPITNINEARPGYLIIANTTGSKTLSDMQLVDKNDDFSVFWVGSK
jgi:hypothetical protein